MVFLPSIFCNAVCIEVSILNSRAHEISFNERCETDHLWNSGVIHLTQGKSFLGEHGTFSPLLLYEILLLLSKVCEMFKSKPL